MSFKHNKKEKDAWNNMRHRCENPFHKDYKNYGARGIRVCPEWVVSFDQFIADVGLAPSPELTLERIDNDKGYYPDNVKWATRSEQQNNTRRRVVHNSQRLKPFEIDGVFKTRAEWCRDAGIKLGTFEARRRAGYSGRDLLVKRLPRRPSDPSRAFYFGGTGASRPRIGTPRIMFQGRSQTLREWSDETKLSRDVIRERLKRGWSVDQALTTPSRKRGR